MFGPDRRAVAAQRRLDQDTAGADGVVDAADPYASGWKSHLAPPAAGWEPGIIVDALPGGYAYRVSAGQRSFLWCSPGGTTGGFGVTGGRPLTTYVVGTSVWFVRHPETPSYGTIVQAEPHSSAHTANQPADSIWPFIRSGQLAETSHQYPLTASQVLGAASGTPIGNTDGADFSSGRPVDGTAVGEWGVMMETGVGVFADPFQAYLRVDESTGVFAFHPDQLLRVAGHNFQQFTSLEEVEHLDDEGELAGVVRRTVYPWENTGIWRWNQVTEGWTTGATPNHGLQAGQGLALNDPLAVQAAVGVATSEPEYFTQISAARGYEYTGYLGQGGQSIIAAPVQLGWAYPSLPAGARTVPASWVPALSQAGDSPPFTPSGRLTVNGTEGPDVQPYAVPPNVRGGPAQPGLYENHVTLGGRWSVRSATGIYLAKRGSIPVPKPLKRQEDPYGDSPRTGPADYHPSGLDAGTAVHRVKSGLTPGSGPPQRAGNVFDVLAYAFNWENVHPFAYHARDWSLAQEGAAGSALINTRVPDYALLAANQYLAAPTPTPIDVDHRYGNISVYENESSLCLMEDGTIVLSDGWGSEIRMHSGNIEFRCAGDIFMVPGRNLTTWAGHDVVLRAHDSVDLTAANGDLRTKADRNSHHLAGNSDCGGFLFESKAVCPVYAFADRAGESVVSSGFTVLCPNSEVLILAQDVAVKLEDTSSDGKIVFDAGNSRHIRTRSRTFVSEFTNDGARVHMFDGSSAPADPTANEFTATHTYLGSNLDVYGTGFFWDNLTTYGWLIANSHVATVAAGTYGNLVSAYSGASQISTTAQAIEDRYDTLMTYRDDVEDEVYYPEEGDDAEFSHRTTAQYRTTSLVFWESRWHTMARNDTPAQTLWGWSEPTVTGLRSSQTTLPHPGTRWLDTGTYLGQDPGYVNSSTGWVAINRDTYRTTYENGNWVTPRTPLPIASVFVIPIQAGPYG